MAMRKSSKHPVLMKTSWYINIPFFLADEQRITDKSRVEYERDGHDGIIIRIGGRP